MPFSLLARIELQLLMQCLDAASIAALAASCRHALAAASHPFAWQCLPPVSRTCGLFNRRSPAQIAAERARSLLQYVPLALHWTVLDRGSALAKQIDAIGSFAPLHSLHILSCESKAGDRFELGPAETPSLVRALLDGPAKASLTNLELERHDVGSEGHQALAQLLMQCPQLADASFQSGSISGAALEMALPSGHLQKLALKNVDLGKEGTAALARGIAASSTLRCLDITACDVGGNAGLSDLADAILSCSSMRELSLSRVHVSSTAAEALARPVAQNRLETLSFDDCDLDDVAVASISDAVATSTSLRSFALLKCSFEGAAYVKVGVALGKSTSLKEFSCSRMSGSALEHFFLGAAASTSLESFSVQDSDVGPKATNDAACTMLRRCRSLRSITLRRCMVNNFNVERLVSALEDPDCSVAFVDLREHGMGPEGAQRLAALVTDVPRIRLVDVRGAQHSSFLAGGRAALEAAALARPGVLLF